eukprot:10013637-Alexandrium_andersonii.AAC.1
MPPAPPPGAQARAVWNGHAWQILNIVHPSVAPPDSPPIPIGLRPIRGPGAPPAPPPNSAVAPGVAQ